MSFHYYGGSGGFTQTFRYLEGLGLLDSLVPFALFFAVLYAVLERTALFKRPVNTVIALAISIMTVVPHIMGLYPPNGDIVVIVNRAAPEIALIIFAVVLVLMLTNIIGGDKNILSGRFGSWAALVLVLLVFVGAFLPKGYLPGFLQFFANPFFYSVMLILLIFGLIVWLVVFYDGNGSPPPRGP